MQDSNKRWLMSVMRTSGSRRKYVQNGTFASERHQKRRLPFEELPRHESVKSTSKFYNGKINYGILVRFLRGQIGQNWDTVYSEILSRIPSKLLDYREMIFWFVATQADFLDGRLWDRKDQKFIWTGDLSWQEELKQGRGSAFYVFYEFYVDPSTNLLQHIPKRAYKRLSS